VSSLQAPGLPEAIRLRAKDGAAATFPPGSYGDRLLGATGGPAEDVLEELRIVPPVLMPNRLEKLFDLGREPSHRDVELATEIGGFASPAPIYVSALGSTRAAGTDSKLAVARQAGRLGIPMVIGENVVPVDGYRESETDPRRSLLEVLEVYAEEAGPERGGVAIQQSTEDADAEVWNLVYSDPRAAVLVESGRLAFELKLGQGAKPGLGGMTLVDGETAERLRGQYTLEDSLGFGPDTHLRMATPGTFTEEILRRQIFLMRNNYPRCRVWVKLPPGRDVALASRIAWEAGADAVVVDGAEGGTGLAPLAFLDHVGLPLGECLLRIAPKGECLCASGRIWEGTRALKCLALGARAVGLGRAALLAVDEDPEAGLQRLVEAMEFELRLLTSALGKYAASELGREDLWSGRQRDLDLSDPATADPEADPEERGSHA
jgi:methylamine---glutamate N-methyltransferase subunit C